MVEEISLKVVDQPPRVPFTKILIGEVSAINATVIKKFLEKLGYNLIVQVDNGVDAVNFAIKEYFNIIFLDIIMPMCGGVEAARMIRKHESQSGRVSTTIVGLTAVYNEEQEEMYNRDYGMDCLLRMPLHITDLKSVLDKYSIPKTVNSLRHLVMMYITNQPHLYHYTSKNPHVIEYNNREHYMSSDVMEELHQMKDSFPPLYKYPNFDGVDTSEILCRIATDYYPLKEGMVQAIDADDILAVRRSATAMAAVLKYVSPDAEGAALEMISSKDCAQALEFMQVLNLYMENVWD